MRLLGRCKRAYLHSQAPPFIHRDVTPYNAVLRPDGYCVLIDLGSPVESPYTEGYAPWEMLDAGVAPDARADQYMLGSLLFSIACGLPAEGKRPRVSTQQILVPADRRRDFARNAGGAKQLSLRLYRPDLSASFCAWVDRMMSLDPGDRFPSDASLLDALPSGPRLGRPQWQDTLRTWAAGLSRLSGALSGPNGRQALLRCAIGKRDNEHTSRLRRGHRQGSG